VESMNKRIDIFCQQPKKNEFERFKTLNL
jgi:hypothetical protein